MQRYNRVMAGMNMTIDVGGFVGKVAQASSLHTGKQDACATYVSRTQFAIILAEGKV